MKNILLIVDGKAGHTSISRGVIESIREHTNVNVIEIKARLRSIIFKRILKLLLNRFSFWEGKKWIIDFFYKKFQFPEDIKYDMIISTGGTTSFLNIMLSKYLHVPNVYCSSLRGLHYKHFTHLVSIEKHNYENEIIVDLAPLVFKYNTSDIDIFRSTYNISKQDQVWSVLIGGRTKEYPFETSDLISMVKNIIDLAKREGATLCITTSRRTSLEVEEKLNDLYEVEKDIIKKIVLYNHKIEKVVGNFLAVSTKVFVTEDSGSMITEAVLSKKNVYTIKSFTTNISGIYQHFIQNLLRKHMIVSVEIESIPKITFKEYFSKNKQSPSDVVSQALIYLFEDEQK